jgi:multidrug efflux pump subunit AcrA (membrane-fusion protein)
MAIDEVPTPGASNYREHIEVRNSSGPWVIVFVVLGLLALGEIYTLAKLGSIGSIQSEQASLQNQVQQTNQQVAAKLSSLQDANAQQLDALRAELDTAAKQAKSPQASRAVIRDRKMLAALEKTEQEQNTELQQAKADLANKANNSDLAAVGKDVADTKTDLGSTKQTVSTLQNDLGMARSDMGTLIARNHDDIETLRKLGQRNYYEFTLARNEEQTVAGVGLMLKKTNVKRHRFNLNLLTNDMAIPKDNRTVDEPVFFTTGKSREFDELVVNSVDQNKVVGYISTPKYSQPELAASAPSNGQ